MDRNETEYQKLLSDDEKAVGAYSRAIHALAAGGGGSKVQKSDGCGCYRSRQM